MEKRFLITALNLSGKSEEFNSTTVPHSKLLKPYISIIFCNTIQDIVITSTWHLVSDVSLKGIQFAMSQTEVTVKLSKSLRKVLSTELTALVDNRLFQKVEWNHWIS